MEQGLTTIFAVIFFFLPILLLFWIYNNAEENGHGGCLWVILVLFFGYAALAVYLIFFSGFISNRQTPGPKRNEDLKYRSMYRAEPASATSKFPNTYGEVSPMQSGVSADSSFQDETLERLIRNGRIKDARDHYNDMVSIAKEMGDRQQVANYKKYDSRIKTAWKKEKAKTSDPF